MEINWKEFFKPTILKLIITFLYAYFLVPVVSYDNGIRCVKAPCPSGWATLFEYSMGKLTNEYIFGFSLINLVIGFIVWYLISCVLVKIGSWLFTKILHK